MEPNDHHSTSPSNGSSARAHDWVVAQDAAQRRAILRAGLLSVALHVVVGLVIGYAPKPDPSYLPEVISVRMVALPSAAPRAKPVPKAAPAQPTAPEPTPAKPKPAPLPKQVILPKQPAVVKKKPKPKPKPLDYDDALNALREELVDEEPLLHAPPQEVAEVVEDAPAIETEAQGAVGQVDPVEAAWKLAVRRHMANVWVVPQDFLDQGLKTMLLVTLSSTGDVLGQPSVLRSSGNPYFDDDILRALVRATPLPAPPEPGDWPFEFNADE